MKTILDQYKTPYEVSQDIARNMVKRRKERKFTQKQLSEQSGVSLGSLKRFEQMYEISLNHLIKIAFVLDCEEEFLELFKKKFYRTIDEVINEQD